jgi:hypothetical protein
VLWVKFKRHRFLLVTAVDIDGNEWPAVFNTLVVDDGGRVRPMGYLKIY